jgi:HAMP domain-containing protein
VEDPLKPLQDELLVLYNSCLDTNQPKFDLEALNDEIEALEKKFKRFKDSILEVRINKGKEALELFRKIEENAKEIEHKKVIVMLPNPLQDKLVVLYNICLETNEPKFDLEALNDEIEALEKKFKRTNDSTLEVRISKGKDALELFRKIEYKEKEEELILLNFNTIEAIKDLEQFASFCFKDTSSTSKEFLENILKINDAITLHSKNLSSLLNHFSYSVDFEANLRRIETQLKFQLTSRNITLNSVRKELDSILGRIYLFFIYIILYYIIFIYIVYF